MSEPQYGVNQSSQTRLAVLAQLIRHYHLDRFDMLEIGSYEGSSALHFSKTIAECCPDGGSVLCVDPWKPYLPAEDVAENDTCRRMEADLAADDVFGRFCLNFRLADPKCPIDFRRGTLGEVLIDKKLIDHDRHFDMIYIDGSHAFQDVLSDILLAMGMLAPDGIICGDDLERQAHEVDPVRLRDIRHREYVDGYHPGVTAAVATVFGKVWSREGAWAMIKGGPIGATWIRPFGE